MLVLARKEEEAIVFPELDITIRVLKVRGKGVSIGIDAPQGVRVLRSELEFEPEAPRARIKRPQALARKVKVPA